MVNDNTHYTGAVNGIIVKPSHHVQQSCLWNVVSRCWYEVNNLPHSENLPLYTEQWSTGDCIYMFNCKSSC